MTIHVDAAELTALLRLTPPSQNILLVGRHGIGKSEIIRATFEDRGHTVVSFFLGQMSDPGDLIGLMHKDEDSGRSVFLPPYWWPAEGEPVVLFLDELNRARPELLQAVQDLTLNRTLAGRRLPEGSIVIAAVNEGDAYQLTDLDPALVSRFNVYTFAPTVEDWLQWAHSAGLDERLIRFLHTNSQHLDGDTEQDWSSDLVKTPDRRSWHRVSDFISDHPEVSEIHIKIIAGIVGSSAALAFARSLQERSLLTGEDVLLRLDHHRDAVEQLDLSELAIVNEQMVLWLEAGRATAKQTTTIGANLLGYMTLLRDGREEGLAHLASLLESPRYDKAMAEVAAHPAVVEVLVEYVDGIET